MLDIVTDSDNKDLEFIVEIEKKIASVLHKLGRDDEANEIERRITSIAEVVEED